jgi:hypothetical protein
LYKFIIVVILYEISSDNNYENTSCKINQTVSDFSDIILSAANTSLKARTPQRRKNHNNKCKKWYDQSLLDMKYNKLRKSKRRAYYSDMMFKLNSFTLLPRVECEVNSPVKSPKLRLLAILN